MLIVILSLSVVVLTIWVFHKKAKKPQLSIVQMSWSPLNVDWLDKLEFLSKNEFSVPDQATRAMHSDQKEPPSFREIFGDSASFSDAQSDVVSQEANYFALPGPTWKENDRKDTTVALTCPLVPPDGMLDAGNPDVLMAQSPERSILPVQ
jgi:hypothetical protein